MTNPDTAAPSLFRKKPVVIEAYRVPLPHSTDGHNAPYWLMGAVASGVIRFDKDNVAGPCAFIDTLEGTMRADAGDWIIKGVKGELYSCRDDIFALTYEPADAPASASAARVGEPELSMSMFANRGDLERARSAEAARAGIAVPDTADEDIALHLMGMDAHALRATLRNGAPAARVGEAVPVAWIWPSGRLCHGLPSGRGDAYLIPKCRPLYEHPPTQPQAEAVNARTDAARDVLAERQRQNAVEAYSATEDDENNDCGQLSKAASAYAWGANYPNILNTGNPPDMWPWDESAWKPAAPRRMLVKAGALILAEIERLDRAAIAAAESSIAAAGVKA